MLAAAQPTARAKRPRGRPKLHEVADIETGLLDIALSEFLRCGYGGTSMSNIVRLAGISKTTLYSRFPSKGELFGAIIERQIQRGSVTPLLKSNLRRGSLEEALEAYANRTLDVSLEGDLLEVNRLILSESHRFPELGAAAAERTQRGIRQVSGFISERAAVDGIPCRNPDAVAQVLIFMLRGWYVEVMLTGREVSTSEREGWVRRTVHALVSGRSDW